MKNNRKKLFEKLKNRGVFWSYSKKIKFEEISEIFFIENVMKYGTFQDLITLFSEYNKKYILSVWKEKLQPDNRFKQLNYFLARIFFNIPLNEINLAKVKNARLEKIKLFASQN